MGSGRNRRISPSVLRRIIQLQQSRLCGVGKRPVHSLITGLEGKTEGCTHKSIINWFLTETQKQFNKGKNLSINDARTFGRLWGAGRARKESQTEVSRLIQNLTKMDHGLKCKTLKLLE